MRVLISTRTERGASPTGPVSELLRVRTLSSGAPGPHGCRRSAFGRLLAALVRLAVHQQLGEHPASERVEDLEVAGHHGGNRRPQEVAQVQDQEETGPADAGVLLHAEGTGRTG